MSWALPASCSRSRPGQEVLLPPPSKSWLQHDPLDKIINQFRIQCEPRWC